MKKAEKLRYINDPSRYTAINERRTNQARVKLSNRVLRRIRAFVKAIPSFVSTKKPIWDRLVSLSIDSLANAQIAIELAWELSWDYNLRKEADSMQKIVSDPLATNEMFASAWLLIEVERVLKM